jgi:hypothetical protein
VRWMTQAFSKRGFETRKDPQGLELSRYGPS